MTLIDADKYFNLIVNAKSAMQCIEKLHSMPTVDAVLVVRCKDCIHSRPDEYGLECMAHYRPTINDGFCNYGEKVTE